jgi:hypothetical protein
MKNQGRLLKLRVAYCGGCNPEIDRGRVVERLCELLKSEGVEVKCVPVSETPDVVLIVNGCAHACKEAEPELKTAPFPVISVQGKRLCYEDTPEDQLPHVLLKKIRTLFIN